MIPSSSIVMSRFISIPSICLLFLFLSPSSGRYHRHSRKILSPHPEASGVTAETASGTAMASGNITADGRNYTFHGPHRTSTMLDSPSKAPIPLSFNPGGPIIPAPTISSVHSISPSTVSQPTITTNNDPTETSCSTVITGFFTKIPITDCSQSVTFSTRESYLLNSTTIPAAGLFRSPTTSTYLVDVVSYFVAPYPSIIAGNTDGISVSVCTLGNDGSTNCTQGPWDQTTYVTLASSTTITNFITNVVTAVTFPTGEVLSDVGNSVENPLAKEAATTTPVGLDHPRNPGPLEMDQKAEAISYGAPPGGWGAISYPPDAGAHLTSYPAPPGGWQAISYPPVASDPPPLMTSMSISQSLTSGQDTSVSPEPTTSLPSPEFHLLVNDTLSTTTLFSTSTILTTVTSRVTINPNSTGLLAPVAKLNEDESTTTITNFYTTTIYVKEVSPTSTAS